MVNIYIPEINSIEKVIENKSYKFICDVAYEMGKLGIDRNSNIYIISRNVEYFYVNIVCNNHLLINDLSLFKNNDFNVNVDGFVNTQLTDAIKSKLFYIFSNSIEQSFEKTSVRSGYIRCDKCGNSFFYDGYGCTVCEQCNNRNEQNDGYVYIIEALNMGGIYKIGWSKEVRKRIKSLVKLPFDIRMIHKIKTDNPQKLESELHERYKHVRANGEWFKLDTEMINEILSINSE